MSSDLLQAFCAVTARDLVTQISALWTQIDQACCRAPLVGAARSTIIAHHNELDVLLTQMDKLIADGTKSPEQRLREMGSVSSRLIHVTTSADLALRGIRQRGYGQAYLFPPFGMFFGLGQAQPLRSLRELACRIHDTTIKSVHTALGGGLGGNPALSSVSVTFQHGMSHALRVGTGAGLQSFVVLPVWMPYSARYFPLVAHEVVHPVVDDLIDHAHWQVLEACEEFSEHVSEAVTKVTDGASPNGRATSDGLAKEALADALATAMYGGSYSLALMAKTLGRFGERDPRLRRKLFPYSSRLRLQCLMLREFFKGDEFAERAASIVESVLNQFGADEQEYQDHLNKISDACFDFLKSIRIYKIISETIKNSNQIDPGFHALSSPRDRWIDAMEHPFDPIQARLDNVEPFLRDRIGEQLDESEVVVEVLWHSRLPLPPHLTTPGVSIPACPDEVRLSVGGLFQGINVRKVSGVIPMTSRERTLRSLANGAAHLDRRYWLVNWDQLHDVLSRSALIVCREVEDDIALHDRHVVARSLGWSRKVEFVPVSSIGELYDVLDTLRGEAGDRITQFLYDRDRLSQSAQTREDSCLPQAFTLVAFVRYKGGTPMVRRILRAASPARLGPEMGRKSAPHVEHVAGYDDMEIRWEINTWPQLVNALTSVQDLQALIPVPCANGPGAQDDVKSGETWSDVNFKGVLAVVCRFGWPISERDWNHDDDDLVE